jgi:hypothetical protein
MVSQLRPTKRRPVAAIPLPDTGDVRHRLRSVLLLFNPIVSSVLCGVVIGLICGSALGLLADRWDSGQLTAWVALLLACGIGMTAGPIGILWVVTKGAQD